MCWTWILTVVSAMSSARAISLLLAPRAMWFRISCSRGDRLWMGSASGGGARGVAARVQRLEGRHQLAGHLGADGRRPLHRALDGAGQQVAVGRLQQVTQRTAAQRRGQVALVLAHGEHQHRGPGARPRAARPAHRPRSRRAGGCRAGSRRAAGPRPGAAPRRRRRPGRPPRSARRRPAVPSGRGGTGCGRRPPARGWVRPSCRQPLPFRQGQGHPCRSPAPTPPPPRRRCVAPARA